MSPPALSELSYRDPGSTEGQLFRLLLHPPAGRASWEGRALARSLGLGRPVSRAVLWKRVQALRKLGYRIEGSPESGYRLVEPSDLPLPWAVRENLGTRRIGREVVFYPTTDSTNVRARWLAERGAPEGTVVLADHQRSGRGRVGRSWHSPAGCNLYLTVLLRPPLPPVRVPPLALAAGLAVAHTLERLGLHPDLKWPNDILLDGRKVSGILAELAAETDRVEFVLLGIGINVNETRSLLPGDLRHSATTLRSILGRPVPRLPLLQCLLQELDHLYTQYLQRGFGALRAAWEHRSSLWGETVRVQASRGETQGTALCLDDGGALLVRVGRRLERVVAGDVVRVRRAP